MKYLYVIFITLLLILGNASISLAKPIIVDLSQRLIEINSSFRGLDVLAFGARNSPGDIVIVIKGDKKDYIVRKKDKIFGVWINNNKRKFYDIYSYYKIYSASSNKKLNENKQTRLEYELGLNYINNLISDHDSLSSVNNYKKALIDYNKSLNFFSEHYNEFTFLFGDSLFKTKLHFPDKLPKGRYTLETYLFDNGKLTAMQTSVVIAKRVGFESFIYNLATKHEVIYGFLAVSNALLFGFLASMIFARAHKK